MHRTTLALLACAAYWVIPLAACTPVEEAVPAADPTADALAPLRLYVFDCGEIQVDAESVAIFSLTAEEAATDILTVPCYLIEHPEGRLVWDAGVPAEATSPPASIAP